MLRFLSHRRPPSSVEFPADPAVLRPFAPLNKTVRISAPKCTLNPRPSHDTEPLHPRKHRLPVSTYLPTIPIHSLTLIQFP
jgi:hypothetical protein